RGEQLRGGAEDREVPVAGVEVKLRVRYRLGVQPGVRGRDRGIGVPVVDRCGDRDGTELEAPGPGEHPQVLGNSGAAAAERLGIAGEEGVARNGLLERGPVDAG